MREDEKAGANLPIPSRLKKLSIVTVVRQRALRVFEHLIGSANVNVEKNFENASHDEVSSQMSKLDQLKARAQARVSEDQVRQQENREAIAIETLEKLSEGEDFDQTQTAVDDDWLNIFGKHAENASSDRLRKLWASVLSGEIRRPGSFSLSTLRLVAELDKEIATKFQKIALERFNDGGFIAKPEKLHGNELLDMIFLEEIGLLQKVTSIGGLNLKQQFSAEGRWGVREGNVVILADGDKNKEFQLNVIKITRIGREIASILPSDPLRAMRKVAQQMKKEAKTVSLNFIVGYLPNEQYQYQMIEKIK